MVNPDVRVDPGVMEDINWIDVVRVPLPHGRFFPEDRPVQRHLAGAPPLARVPEEVDRPERGGVEFLQGGGEVVEAERERRDDDVVRLDILTDDGILPAHRNRGVVGQPCGGHLLTEEGEHASRRIEGRDVVGGPGNRHSKPSSPGTHIEHGLAGREIQDRKFLFRRALLAAGGPPVGGGTPVPVGSGIADFLDMFGRTYVNRLPKLVPVDDPVHRSSPLFSRNIRSNRSWDGPLAQFLPCPGRR